MPTLIRPLFVLGLAVQLSLLPTPVRASTWPPIEARLGEEAIAQTALPEVSAPSPEMAVALSLLTPPALVLATWGVNSALGTPYLAQQTRYYAIPPEYNAVAIYLSPLGFGAGYLYAGAPERALPVGLVGTAITASGFGYLASLRGPDTSFQMVSALALMSAALVGYGWWVHQDVSQLVDARRRPLPTPLP